MNKTVTLREYVEDPEVTEMVDSAQSAKISIYGDFLEFKGYRIFKDSCHWVWVNSEKQEILIASADYDAKIKIKV